MPHYSTRTRWAASADGDGDGMNTYASAHRLRTALRRPRFRARMHVALQPGACRAAGIMAAIASSAERIA
jgi:hypothetical protein